MPNVPGWNLSIWVPCVALAVWSSVSNQLWSFNKRMWWSFRRLKAYWPHSVTCLGKALASSKSKPSTPKRWKISKKLFKTSFAITRSTWGICHVKIEFPTEQTMLNIYWVHCCKNMIKFCNQMAKHKVIIGYFSLVV